VVPVWYPESVSFTSRVWERGKLLERSDLDTDELSRTQITSYGDDMNLPYRRFA
jgi:hypothetical protein